MVVTTPRTEIISAIRTFPAKKGTSRTVDGNKQYQLYRNTDSSGRGLVLVGFYDSNNKNRLTYQIQVIPKYNAIDTYVFDSRNGLGLTVDESDGIANDFIRELGIKEQEQQQFEEDQKKVMQVNLLQEETVRGQKISITAYIDAYVPKTQTYQDLYEVDVPNNFGGKKNFPTLEEAEAYYNQVKDSIQNRRESGRDEYQYNGYTIIYQYTRYLDGELDLEQTFYTIEGLEPQYQSTFNDGDVVRYNGATADVTFGTISLDVENDLIILKEYLDIIDNPPQEEAEENLAPNGTLPIYSWGWYRDNSPQSAFSPFSECKLIETYTISQTDGRIMGITDSDVWTVPSGAVQLKVKDGYRVTLRLLTQESGYWESHIPNISANTLSYKTRGWGEVLGGEAFNQETNYIDTDLVEVELFGGDSISIDIDSEVDGIGTFSIIANGKQIVKGAPRSIDNETFMIITDVFKDVQGQGEAKDERKDEDESENKPMSWIPVVVAGVLVIGIMYLVFSSGGEE